MLLTAFIVLQLILDVEVVLFLVLRHRRRKRLAAAAPAPAAAPPPWHRDFVLLAEDVLTMLEPVLDALERGAPIGGAPPAPSAPGAPAPAPMPRDRHREAFALLRAGTPAEEVARREQLSPAQMRLIGNLVAAEGRLAGAARA